MFDYNHVWTFQMYEHVLDYNTFTLNLPFFKLDLVQVGGEGKREGLRD